LQPAGPAIHQTPPVANPEHNLTRLRKLRRVLPRAQLRSHFGSAADSFARDRRPEDGPSLPLRPSPDHAAAGPGTRPDAGQARARGGLDVRYDLHPD
jgi:hypothetical protein